jgi:5,10-methylenetetrahydromethanopterin reductase
MRLGYFGNVLNDGTIDDVVASVAWAEKEGYASYWGPQIFGNDALTAFAIVAREVPRIELGTGVVPTFPRHPLTLAQQCLTVNAAAGGRLCLGIGLSHKIVIENMFGLSYDKPVRHMREYLTVLGAVVRDGSVSFDGDVYKVHAGVQVNGSSPFPVLVAALGAQMLKVTAELADGTVTWMTGPETLREHIVPTINSAAEAAGKPQPRVVAALPVCVTDDVAAAKEWSSKVFSVYGQLPSYRAMLDREGAAGPSDVAIIGGEQEVIDRIGALADTGVTDFVVAEFSTAGDDAERTRAAVKSLL